MKQTMRIKTVYEKLSQLHEINKHFPVKLSYAIAKNIKTLASEAQNADELRAKILKDRCLKDDEGRPVVKDGTYQFDSDEIKENTIKEIGEINDTEVEIELMPLSLELIETCDSGMSFIQLIGALNILFSLSSCGVFL